jgi:hypothetical protein
MSDATMLSSLRDGMDEGFFFPRPSWLVADENMTEVRQCERRAAEETSD